MTPDDFINNIVLIDTSTHKNMMYKWWVLTRKNYEAPYIYPYKDTNSTIELKLDILNKLESPHALSCNGESLWIGDLGENESIYLLNSKNGAIISEIKNIKTEGIAVLDDYILYLNGKMINKIEKDGTLAKEIATKNSWYIIPDIAIDGTNLYYPRNSEKEPIKN